MSHEYHRRRPRFPDAQQFKLQDFACLRVDRAERFIHQQHARPDGERARESAPLLHPAGYLVGVIVLEPGESHQIDELRHRLLDFGTRSARKFEAVSDVVEHRLPWKEPEMLKHHGDALARRGYPLPLDRDFTLGKWNQPVNAPQQRRLAAPRGTDDREHLALADFQADSAEHL